MPGSGAGPAARVFTLEVRRVSMRLIPIVLVRLQLSSPYSRAKPTSRPNATRAIAESRPIRPFGPSRIFLLDQAKSRGVFRALHGAVPPLISFVAAAASTVRAVG